MDNSFRLGEDLRTYDNLLDPVTFDDLILQLHCNLPKDRINKTSVREELRSLLDIRTDDMLFLLKKNIDMIIQYALENYRDE